jgi:hypothetical protein
VPLVVLVVSVASMEATLAICSSASLVESSRDLSVFIQADNVVGQHCHHSIEDKSKGMSADAIVFARRPTGFWLVVPKVVPGANGESIVRDLVLDRASCSASWASAAR